MARLPGTNLTGNNIRVGGYLSGGELGCNYQTNNIVFGIEGDGSWTYVKGDKADFPGALAGQLSSTEEKWLATLRGRIGVAWGPAMVYMTGGGAWASVRAGQLNLTGPVNTTETQTLSGWTVGAGLEWQLIGPVTAKVEYLYVDLGTGHFFSTQPNGIVARDVTTRQHIARIGMNYKFTP